MNIIYECRLCVDMESLQDCDQHSTFLNALPVLCIYQFPKIFPENIFKILYQPPVLLCIYKENKQTKKHLKT